MGAPTAGSILRELDRRRYSASIAALADIADQDRDAVVRALGSVSPRSKVDVGVLVETLRKEAAERAEAEAARRAKADPTIYEALLRSQGWRPWVSGRPDKSESRPRRRVRSRRQESGEDADPSPPRVETAEAPAIAGDRRPGAFRRRFLVGSVLGADLDGRPLGCPVDADYDAWESCRHPPWLIDEEPDTSAA